MSERRYCRRFVTRYLRQDGVFLLRLIGLNKDEIVVGELLGELWRKYRADVLHSSTGTSKQSDDEGVADAGEDAEAGGDDDTIGKNAESVQMVDV